MKYPGNIHKDYKKVINYKNRGMTLESIINDASKYYLEHDMAVIYKKPTPIGVVDVDYKNGAIIKKAYFKEPSTLDYNGLYLGKYVEFDAKECQSKTSFPLKNIHEHQIKHIRNILCHGGIVFLIIAMNEKYFLFKGEDLLDFIKNEDRKSIPYSVILQKGFEVKYNYMIGLDYLKGIIEAYKGVDFNEKIKN